MPPRVQLVVKKDQPLAPETTRAPGQLIAAAYCASVATQGCAATCALSVGSYDQQQEDEAAWFGCVLLPRPALMRRRLSQAAASVHFGISLELLRWRLLRLGAEAKPGIGPSFGRLAAIAGGNRSHQATGGH